MRFTLRSWFIVITLLCILLSQTHCNHNDTFTNLWFNFPPTGHRLHFSFLHPSYCRALRVMVGSTAEDGTPYQKYRTVYKQIFWLEGDNGEDYWMP